jgi:Methyltransferase domain
LDIRLFDRILAQTDEWDKQALLALHDASAREFGSFGYLEIGSYLGGSMQAVVQDPRCTKIISIDPRPAAAADNRTGTWSYPDNTTAHMLELLGDLPGADLSKVDTFEVGTDALTVDALRTRPHYCFIDGEHTDEAALCDARFCAEALGGRGVIAFHDYDIVRTGIEVFVGEVWRDVSMAVAFTGSIFAVELGGAGVLRSRPIYRAIGSRWHSILWRFASKPTRTPTALLGAWSAMAVIDATVVEVRRTLSRRSRQASTLAGVSRSHHAAPASAAPPATADQDGPARPGP